MMSKPELGTKRVCGACGAKFYDLNKDPMTCPKCGAQFDVTTLMATRFPSTKAREKPEPEEVREEAELEEPLVALEVADAEEADTGRAEPEIPEDDLPDLDAGEDLGDADKEQEFLEAEEEDDDVSALIESDIEDEED